MALAKAGFKPSRYASPPSRNQWRGLVIYPVSASVCALVCA